MSQKSSIETGLDDDDRKALDQLIASGKLSLNGLLEWLGEKGYDISRSALHRHVQKVEVMGAKLRQSRAMTEALVKDLGPDVTEGKQGRLLVEVLRAMVNDHLLNKIGGADDEDGGSFGSKDFALLAKALKDMASANKIDLDRELKIREDAEKKAKVAAAEAIEEMAQEENEKGLSRDTVEAIKARILGVKVDKGGA